MNVTLDNSFDVYYYCQQALDDPKRQELILKDPELENLTKAKRELDQLPKLEYCDATAYYQAKADNLSQQSIAMHGDGRPIIDLEPLQVWCDTYLSKDGWRRCLNNIKQSRFHAKHNRNRINLWISRSHHRRLKRHADACQAESLDQMLGMLLDAYEQKPPRQEED